MEVISCSFSFQSRTFVARSRESRARAYQQCFSVFHRLFHAPGDLQDHLHRELLLCELPLPNDTVMPTRRVELAQFPSKYVVSLSQEKKYEISLRWIQNFDISETS